MNLIDLKVAGRTAGDGSSPGALRNEGRIPAILYGPSTENAPLSVETAEFEDVLRAGGSGQTLLNLVMENGESKQVMIKELQRHPLTRKALHIDFYAFDVKKKMKVKVPVATVGACVGVEMGGILQLIRREVELLCLPLEMPEVIEVNVTEMTVGDSLHVQEIELPDGVEIVSDVNYTIVTVLSPKVEEEEVPDEEEEGEEIEGEEEEDQEETDEE
ncbi:50S ribosomal protein L25 [Candidatus Desulfarcum epimagneticum]|uniref:Large ribosomal subunit protein bL25 n=1 Tax=uncultured Desulfobacteraceae bacterium TaxID=218296 RepID=A0A484HKP2_9BACT|nr:50S ribosomal protein L25 [uncultured Desulfobacteraceae bacterium]